MYLDSCNCAYTTKGNEKVSVSITALMKVISELPKAPKLFTMPIEIIKSPLVPENYIILSDSVAEALEQALQESKKEM